MLVAVALGGAQPKDDARQPPGSSNPEVVSALENVAAALQQPHETSKLEEPCDSRDDKRTSDLCAQWKAADAAKSAALAAWLLGGLGTIIGASTLAAAWAAAKWAKKAAIHTEESAMEGRRAADASEQALTYTRETNLREYRPWLLFHNCRTQKIDGEINGVSVKNGLRFTVEFKNVGRSPAMGASLLVASCFQPSSEEPPTFTHHDLPPPEGVVGIGQSMWNGNTVLDDTQSEQLLSGAFSIYIHGWAVYRDQRAPDEDLEAIVTMRLDYVGDNRLPNGERFPEFTTMLVGENRVT